MEKKYQIKQIQRQDLYNFLQVKIFYNKQDLRHIIMFDLRQSSDFHIRGSNSYEFISKINLNTF